MEKLEAKLPRGGQRQTHGGYSFLVHGRIPEHRTHIRRYLTACRISGIKGLRFHDLRHTFATRLREMGVAIEDVRDFLGHSSITTTERYSHRNEERQRKAIQLLQERPR